MMKRKRRITKAYFDLARRKYMPLVQKLAIKVGIPVEELESLAGEELLKCMICYDRKGLLMTFLFSRLFGVFRHKRDAENRAKRISIMSLDSMVNIAAPSYDIDSNMMVQESMECLTDSERGIITDIYFKEQTMREISVDRGIITSDICRIKARAINKMKRKWEMKLR